MVGTINVGSGSPAGVQYSSLPQFMNNFSQTSIRFEYVGNSMVTAGDEMIDAGVIFVCSSGNTNQKLVKADHPDYDNYWATSPDTAYANAYTTYYGYLAYNSINRQGFPGQIGKLGSGSNSLYRTIPVGALDDFLNSTTGTGTTLPPVLKSTFTSITISSTFCIAISLSAVRKDFLIPPFVFGTGI